MKKMIILAIAIILIIPNISFAYETEKYEIEMPSFMTQTTVENVYADAEGNSVNVYLVQKASEEKIPYTEEYLNIVTKEIIDNMDQYKAEIKGQLMEQYGDTLDEAHIESLLSDMQYKDFLKKEITTFGAEAYPCIHYISNIYMAGEDSYSESYQTDFGDTIFTLTINSDDPSFFEREDIKQSVASFKIKGYIKDTVDNNSNINPVIPNESNNQLTTNEITIIIGSIVIILVGLIIIASKTKEEKKIVEEKKNSKKSK